MNESCEINFVLNTNAVNFYINICGYDDSPDDSQYRITEEEDIRITEDGNFRILE